MIVLSPTSIFNLNALVWVFLFLSKPSVCLNLSTLFASAKPQAASSQWNVPKTYHQRHPDNAQPNPSDLRSSYWQDQSDFDRFYQQFDDPDVSIEAPKVRRQKKKKVKRPEGATQTRYFYFIHDPRKFPDFDIEESLPLKGDTDYDHAEEDDPQTQDKSKGKAAPERNDQLAQASSYGGGGYGAPAYVPQSTKHQYKTSEWHFLLAWIRE